MPPRLPSAHPMPSRLPSAGCWMPLLLLVWGAPSYAGLRIRSLHACASLFHSTRRLVSAHPPSLSAAIAAAARLLASLSPRATFLAALRLGPSAVWAPCASLLAACSARNRSPSANQHSHWLAAQHDRCTSHPAPSPAPSVLPRLERHRHHHRHHHRHCHRLSTPAHPHGTTAPRPDQSASSHGCCKATFRDASIAPTSTRMLLRRLLCCCTARCLLLSSALSLCNHGGSHALSSLYLSSPFLRHADPPKECTLSQSLPPRSRIAS